MRPYLCILLFLTATLPAMAAIDSPRPTETDTSRYSTVNSTDSKGFRQGYWRLLGSMTNEDDYRRDQLVEEGVYLDNKRNGLWKKYYPSGAVRSEINFENNHPRGFYKTYYDNGAIEEVGDWQGNRNVGDFKRYHRNGRVAQEFTFNEYGKRHGLQVYYYPNGKKQMTVEVENGTAHGMMVTYYQNGEIKSEKRLTNGSVEGDSVQEFKASGKIPLKKQDPYLPEEETIPSTADKPNLAAFKHNGFNTLYNRNQQITQVGDFKEGRLWNGKWYKYDSDGLLRKAEMYSEGRFIGYGVIED